MWFCLIFYVLQLYKYTITLNSPSAQTSCVYLLVEVLVLHVLQLFRYTITLNSPSAQTSCVYLWVDGYLRNVLSVKTLHALTSMNE